MKRKSPKLKLLVLSLFAIALSIGLFQTRRSTAASIEFRTRATLSAQDKGTVVARLKDYDPKLDGFSIHNYGGYQGIENELYAGDLLSLLGAENVCESGSTAQDCVLYEPAEEWLQKQFKMLANGHCDGFAITSLRFWMGLPFEGKSDPAAWQTGAQSVFDLKRSEALENYIAYYHVMQA